MKIAVAGTGYVGLSMATLLAQHHYPDFKHCRQRIRYFLRDNEIADLGITATENGYTVHYSKLAS